MNEVSVRRLGPAELIRRAFLREKIGGSNWPWRIGEYGGCLAVFDSHGRIVQSCASRDEADFVLRTAEEIHTQPKASPDELAEIMPWKKPQQKPAWPNGHKSEQADLFKKNPSR